MSFELLIESVQNQLEVIQFLDDRVYEHNSSKMNQLNGELFTKVIRDENKNIIAGITGWTWAAVSEITLFWIKEEYRKKGLGTKLLTTVEAELRKNGCATILIRSYSFQAPSFYVKNGYKIAFVMENFPKGSEQYSLVKRFGASIL